jgi:hypothetical protein
MRLTRSTSSENDMSTTGQREARQGLRLMAPGHRVTSDSEGWPIVSGRYGRLEYDAYALTAYTDRRRLHARLLAIPGITRNQRGDTELRVVLTEQAVPAVTKLFRSRRRGRVLSTEQAKKLGATTAYRATSGPQEMSELGRPT